MFDSYCADLDVLLRDGQLRPAVRAAVSLPDVCAALEHPRLMSSAAQYTAWCDTWVRCDSLERGQNKGPPSQRLHRLFLRIYLEPTSTQVAPLTETDATVNALRRFRMRRRARPERPVSRKRVWQPANRLQKFEAELVESLVSAARRWYRERAAENPRVQQNLGRLAITG